MAENKTTQTVLVCEDDAETRGLLAHILSGMDLAVLEAGDGLEAKEILFSASADLILLDLMMPRMSGEEFLKWYRSEERPFTPVLVITAKTEVQDRIEGFRLGADDYLTKPYELGELRARVLALLRTKRLTDTLRKKNEELIALQEELIKRERQLATAQLAGAAAHNLGQPLTSVILQCELLQSELGEKNERVTAAVERIEKECRLMDEIIKKLRAADSSKTVEYSTGVQITDIERGRK